jgi:hypothetical protein
LGNTLKDAVQGIQTGGLFIILVGLVLVVVGLGLLVVYVVRIVITLVLKRLDRMVGRQGAPLAFWLHFRTPPSCGMGGCHVNHFWRLLNDLGIPHDASADQASGSTSPTTEAGRRTTSRDQVGEVRRDRVWSGGWVGEHVENSGR